jgi:hypothetical protein
MPAVEQLEDGVIGSHARLIGQYRQLAAVADGKVLRGVIGHPPAGADEAALYLPLIRNYLLICPRPFATLAISGKQKIRNPYGRNLGRVDSSLPASLVLLLPIVYCHNIVVPPRRASRMSGLVPQALVCPRLGIVKPGVGELVRQMAFTLSDVVYEAI